MRDVLSEILAAKRVEVEEARARVSAGEIEARARVASPARGFERALRAEAASGQPAVICVKREPEPWLIRADFSTRRGSRLRDGAAALGATTANTSGGSSETWSPRACALPVLRKDFIVDRYQVHEARAWGADCILLIVDAVPDAQLRDLEREARGLGLDILVECHDDGQLERALSLETALIGINNRDLTTFETRLETTLGLVARVPAGRLLITESGIGSPADVARLKNAKVSAYLVGSAFMAAPDPGNELSRLFSGL